MKHYLSPDTIILIQKRNVDDNSQETDNLSFFNKMMNMNLKTTFPLFLGISIIIITFTGCSGNKETEHKNLPEDVKPVAEAILNNSPSQFAGAVSYPIERPYPLPSVNDSAEMVDYYSTLVDNNLKEKIEHSPDSLWQLDGWRGWTFDDGSYLWIDNGKIYAIDYISQREEIMLDSLRGKELESLDPSMRTGWTPVMCVIDSVYGDIFRIDSDSTKQPTLYRLAGYVAGSNLSGKPSVMLYGSLNEQGSAGSRLFHFADSVGTIADYIPDILDPDSVPVIEISYHGKMQRYHVRPSRWLNHISPQISDDNTEVNDSAVHITDTPTE